MPATVRSVGTGSSGSGTLQTFSPTMPLGFTAGDLLIGVACNGGGDVPASRPSGSLLVQNIDDGTVFNMDVVRKVAVGGDVFTWTSITARKWAGFVIAVTAGTYNTTTPLGGTGGVAQGTTTATTFTTPSVTPGGTDTLALAFFGNQTATTWATSNTNPSMTEIADLTSSGTTPASAAAYRSNTAPSNVAYTRSAIAGLSTANAAMFLTHVNPATAAGPPARGKVYTPGNRSAQRASRW